MSLKEMAKKLATVILPPADEPIPNQTAARLYDTLDQLLGNAKSVEMTQDDGDRLVIARSDSDAFHVELDKRGDAFLVVQRHMAWRHLRTSTGLDKRSELSNSEMSFFNAIVDGMVSLVLEA